jgi:hypothetical protein
MSCGIDIATGCLAIKWMVYRCRRGLPIWVCNLSVPGKVNILLFFVVCTSFFSPYERNDRCSIEIKSPYFFERVSNLIVPLYARSQLCLPIATCRSLTALRNRTWWETCEYWEELKGRAAAGSEQSVLRTVPTCCVSCDVTDLSYSKQMGYWSGQWTDSPNQMEPVFIIALSM